MGTPLFSDEISSKTSKVNCWVGDTDFDLSQVVYLDIEIVVGPTYDIDSILIDWLCFSGPYEIDPFQHPSLNPPVYSSSSIADYGISVYEHTDRDIKSFDQAQAEAERILYTLKDPVEKITLTKASYPWLRPTQTVPLNLASLDMTGNETWRIVEVIQNWMTGRKVYTTLELVYPATIRTPPVVTPSTGAKWWMPEPGTPEYTIFFGVTEGNI